MIFAKLEIEPQMEICVKKIMDGFAKSFLFRGSSREEKFRYFVRSNFDHPFGLFGDSQP